ncbi:MAG: GGDEF domain-containing protein, partial [Roseburia sp.]|nr:GGDEF domain-containing protein [Roseburia sp.]
MNTFSKLYDTELHNQEIKSNKRTLMGFCWFFLTLLLVWVLTMINFFLISKFLISLSLGFTVLLLIPPVIIYKKADLSSPWIKYLFLALISIICSIITALLTYHAVLIFV